MESYILDKTFLSIGSIGTGVAVRAGLGSPASMENRVKTYLGTNTPGTVLPLGVSIVGCSETGKEVQVRLAGIAKTKMAVTSGSIVQGKQAFPASNGKVKVKGKFSGTVPCAFLGQIINAEGKGSADSPVSVMVQPHVSGAR